MGPTQVLRIRRCAATLASLGLLAVFVAILRDERPRGAEWALGGIFVALPLVAGAAVWWERLGAQLLTRGIWWSFLLLGGLIAVTNGPSRHHEAVLLTTSAAAALLVAGSTGLGPGRGRFKPVAFRGTLLLALVLAIADTCSFVWVGTVNLIDGWRVGVLLLVPAMIAGVIGLLRLRTWGLIVSLLSNVAVVVLSSTRLIHLPDAFRALFIGTAALQLLVPAPMLVSIALGRRPAPEGWQRTKRVVSTAVIVGVVALSWYCTRYGGWVRLSDLG